MKIIKELFSGLMAPTPSPTEHKVTIKYSGSHYLVWDRNGGKPRHYQYPQTFTWDETKEVVATWDEPSVIFQRKSATIVRGLDGVSVKVTTNVTFSHSLTDELMKCESVVAAQHVRSTYFDNREAMAGTWFHDIELPETIRKFAEEVKYVYDDETTRDKLADKIEMFINPKAGEKLGSSGITVVGYPQVVVHPCDDDARTQSIFKQRKYEESKRTAELENDLAIRKLALETERKAATNRRDLAEVNEKIALTKAMQELRALDNAEADARETKSNEIYSENYHTKERALAQTRKHELLMKLVERLPEAIEVRKDADGKETKTATNLNIADLFKQVTLLIDGRSCGLTSEELNKKLNEAYDHGVQDGKNAAEFERGRTTISQGSPIQGSPACWGSGMGLGEYRTKINGNPF